MVGRLCSSFRLQGLQSDDQQNCSKGRGLPAMVGCLIPHATGMGWVVKYCGQDCLCKNACYPTMLSIVS